MELGPSVPSVSFCSKGLDSESWKIVQAICSEPPAQPRSLDYARDDAFVIVRAALGSLSAFQPSSLCFRPDATSGAESRYNPASMPGPVLLSVESLTKSYTSRPLFENLSFTVAEGDHIGLIGPNGSGKSTLLKILAGVEDPDSGTRALRKGVRVGYVPQDPVFAPGKSVEEVLLDALHGETTLDDYERVARVATALGKAGFNDRTLATETLSGGWRKRLGIAP